MDSLFPSLSKRGLDLKLMPEVNYSIAGFIMLAKGEDKISLGKAMISSGIPFPVPKSIYATSFTKLLQL